MSVFRAAGVIPALWPLGTVDCWDTSSCQCCRLSLVVGSGRLSLCVIFLVSVQLRLTA